VGSVSDSRTCQAAAASDPGTTLDSHVFGPSAAGLPFERAARALGASHLLFVRPAHTASTDPILRVVLRRTISRSVSVCLLIASIDEYWGTYGPAETNRCTYSHPPRLFLSSSLGAHHRHRSRVVFASRTFLSQQPIKTSL
jgi:hypothetical protein